MFLEATNASLADLQSFHELEKERGRVAPHAVLHAPKIGGKAGYAYLLRWRAKFGISYRTVFLRFKCNRQVLVHRLRIFWSSVIQVRILHMLLVEMGLEMQDGACH